MSATSLLPVHLFQHLNADLDGAAAKDKVVPQFLNIAIQNLSVGVETLSKNLDHRTETAAAHGYGSFDKELFGNAMQMIPCTQFVYKGLLSMTTVRNCANKPLHFVEVYNNACMQTLQALYDMESQHDERIQTKGANNNNDCNGLSNNLRFGMTHHHNRALDSTRSTTAWTIANISFPATCHLLCRGKRRRKASELLLRNTTFLRVGAWFVAEKEFKQVVAEGQQSDGVAVVELSPSYNVLDALLQEGTGIGVDVGQHKNKRWAQYIKNNVLDEYIRRRESELTCLRHEAFGILNSSHATDYGRVVGNAVQFCLSHLDSTRYPCLTVRFFSYQELLRPHPEQARINVAVNDWVESTFTNCGLDNLKHLYLGDQLLYVCVCFMYSHLEQVDVLIELCKSVVLGLSEKQLGLDTCPFA